MGPAAQALDSHTRRLPQPTQQTMSAPVDLSKAGAGMSAGAMGSTMRGPAPTQAGSISGQHAGDLAPGASTPQRQITSMYQSQPKQWERDPAQAPTNYLTTGANTNATVQQQPTSLASMPTPVASPGAGVGSSYSGLTPAAPTQNNSGVGSSALGLASTSTTETAPESTVSEEAQTASDRTSGQVPPEVIQQYIDMGYTIDEEGDVKRPLTEQEASANSWNPFAPDDAGVVVTNIYDYEGDPEDDLTARMTKWSREQETRKSGELDAEAKRNQDAAIAALQGGVNRVDEIKGLDPAILENALRAQRQARDRSIAQARQDAEQAAINQGLGAAGSAFGADLALDAKLTGQDQDAQKQLMFGLQDFQAKMQQTQQALGLISQMANIYAGTSAGQMAAQNQRELLEYQNKLNQDMAIFMQRFEPTFLEKALGGLAGVVGTAGGTMAGAYLGKVV